MVCFEQLPLTSPHRGLVVGVGVIPSQDVKNTVHHQERHLVVQRTGVGGRLTSGDLGTDHHVTEKERHFGGIGIGTIGTPGPSTGIDIDDGAAVDRERQNVGRAGTPHVCDVEFRHVVDSHEENTELAGPSYPFGVEDFPSKGLPALDVDLDNALLVGTENFGNSVTSHFRTTTKPWRTSGHFVPFFADCRSYASTISATMR